ncbi:hypothetical protein OGATHE_004952 [Ogataea polymorpha]|uniref:Uncharacterized protein n=1 Tax=Ogataea polymorpha TaxID=460523 RepID=A0A9P8T084_9ASCO|nr:hypothetical protein OGATHE_004952 [Ogataea polymorpha]
MLDPDDLTVHVGEQEKKVCVAHSSSDGRKRIVIAKFDLLRRNCIILVDNGDNSHVQQLDQGIFSVSKLRKIRDVVPGEQDLSSLLIAVTEHAVPQRLELTLSQCGKRLHGR